MYRENSHWQLQLTANSPNKVETIYLHLIYGSVRNWTDECKCSVFGFIKTNKADYQNG